MSVERRPNGDSHRVSSGVDWLGVPALPFAFQHRQLLLAKDFADLARDHGLWLTEAGLEQLHRERILLPVYWVRRARWDIAARRRSQRCEGPDRQWRTPRTGHEVAEDRAARLVRLAARRPFRPWEQERLRVPSGAVVTRGDYLYSAWQVLALPAIRDVVPHLRRRAERTSHDRRVIRSCREAVASADRMALILSILEPWPRSSHSGRIAGTSSCESGRDISRGVDLLAFGPVTPSPPTRAHRPASGH
jgi:hypothetical protein